MLQVVTSRAVTPVTLGEARDWLKMDATVDDAVIGQLVEAATAWAEEYTRRALGPQTLRYWFDPTPARGGDDWWDGAREGAIGRLSVGWVDLPRPPLVSVVRVAGHLDTYRPATEVTPEVGVVVVDPTAYYVTATDPARVALALGGTWPAAVRRFHGLSVDYTAGYPTPERVPGPIKTAILQIVASSFENRSAVEVGTIATKVPMSAHALLDPFVVMRV